MIQKTNDAVQGAHDYFEARGISHSIKYNPETGTMALALTGGTHHPVNRFTKRFIETHEGCGLVYDPYILAENGVVTGYAPEENMLYLASFHLNEVFYIYYLFPLFHFLPSSNTIYNIFHICFCIIQIPTAK